MSEMESLLEFAESLIQHETSTFCSELQRQILITALKGERKTYDQLAEECRYSPSYVKQDVAPKLWHLLSQILSEKVTKANVRKILIHAMQEAEAVVTPKSEGEKSVVTPTAAIASEPSPLPFQSASADSLSVLSTPLTHPKILLVDDQPKNLRLLTELLEEQEYQTMQALNGAIALDAMKFDTPDLILLDIQMPEMDGYTVCQKIKADPATAHIPVIFVSALEEAWDKVRAFSVGGVDYITKPFKVVEVLARVENHLKIQQLQQALTAQNAQLRQAIQELQRFAAIDELTQVASRRRFDAYLLEKWQIAIQSQTPLTLMFCQLDHFNFYGDGSSQQQGDQVLCRVAQLIQQTVTGDDDLVCRYGTLTFAVLLPQQNDGEAIAQALLQNIQALAIGDPTSETLSIGINTMVPTADLGIEAFLDGCDRHLQQAQDKGGNCYIL